MRVGIDLTGLLAQHVGVDRYLVHLVVELGRLDRDSRYLLFVNVGDRRLFDGRIPPNFSVVPVAIRRHASRLAFQQALLTPSARLVDLDVVHSPSLVMPLLRGRRRHLVTVHDMTQFSLPDCHTRLRRSFPYREAIRQSILRADLVAVPSRHAADTIDRWVPGLPAGHVRTIPEGVAPEFSPDPTAGVPDVARRLGVRGPYVLYVGTLEPRKNVDLLIDSYRQLVLEGDLPEHLVLAGKRGWGYEGVLERLRDPALEDRVHLVGYVDQGSLPALYAEARAFVYPSREEGFGLPPLEAMACGAPTVATDGSALAENLAGAAELVPVDDRDALAAALRRVLRDDGHREQLRERGLARAAEFRWEATARATHDCYRELAALGRRPGWRPGARARRG